MREPNIRPSSGPPTIQHDEMGRVVRYAFPDGIWGLYEYDDLGRVRLFECSSGIVTSYTYNEVGERTTSVTALHPPKGN